MEAIDHQRQPPGDSTELPPLRPLRLTRWLDRHAPLGWEYILPMALFLGFIQLGTIRESFYPYAYVARSILVALALWWLWPRFTRVRWTHLGLGAVVGVVGIALWIGIEEALFFGRTALGADTALGRLLAWTSLLGADEKGFVPYEEIPNPWLMWGFIAIRWATAFLVVPVMEELFWRDWLWRNIASPNDFRLEPVGSKEPSSIWIVSIAFSFVHFQWLVAIVWGLLIAWLLVRTRSIGACIVAHGVSNLLLGAYVLGSWKIFDREVWWFW